MCRFLLFVGREPILIADLITRPQHSIITQSFYSKLRVDQRRPLNGDGFGIGYYLDDVQSPPSNAAVSPNQDNSTVTSPRLGSLYMDSVLSQSIHDTRVTVIPSTDAALDPNGSEKEQETEQHQQPKPEDAEDNESQLMKAYTMPGGPCVFTSILPAWNNLNLIRLSEKIRSRLVFAHVRAASPGFPIAETNCHPWCYGRFLWMHNGFLAEFHKIKRTLQASLRDELFHYVQGNTDSEWSFALFLNQFTDPLNGSFTHAEIREAMAKTIALINQWYKEAGITAVSLMNFAVSDGKSVVCSRYVNSRTTEPASLFYSSGSRFEAVEPGSLQYKMIKCDKREDIVVVTSEPLTYERSDWMTVPPNSMIVVTHKLNVLTFPIQDEYYNLKRERTKTLNCGQVWG